VVSGHLIDVRHALAKYDGFTATALIIDLQALSDDLHTAVDQLLAADRNPSDGLRLAPPTGEPTDL
jgi:hypothetical protein